MPEIGRAREVDTAGRLRIVTRPNFSSHLMASSATLADHAKEIEDSHSGEPRFDVAHRGYVVSSIISAVSFLEAMINELFQDAYDDHTPKNGAITPLEINTRHLMAEYWRATDSGIRGGTLDKCQALLRFTGAEVLQKDTNPYRDALYAIQLRNAIVHFRPQDLSSDVPHKLQDRLKGKFADNQMMEDSGNPWWPNKCLGWGCARWSLEAVTELADHLVKTTGVQPAYVHFRTKNELGNVP